MKCRKSIRWLAVVMVLATLVCVAWQREDYSIYQLRVNTIRGANDTDTITIVNPVTITGAATFSTNISVAGTATFTGPQSLEQGITEQNDTVGDYELIFTNTSSTLAQHILLSTCPSNTTAGLADNDLMEFVMRAYCSSGYETDYVKFRGVITDYTAGSEDSYAELRYLEGATEYAGLTVGSTAGGDEYCDIGPSDADVAGLQILVCPASSEYFVQCGRTAADGVAITFATAFSATPAVMVDYDNTIVGRNEAAYAYSVSATGFTPGGYAASTYSWVAVGLR